MRSWGTVIDSNVEGQIKARENLVAKDHKSVEELQYLNSNTAWVMLRSGVDTETEGSDLAKKYVLCGGTIKASGDSFTYNPGIDLNKKPAEDGSTYRNTTFGFRPEPGITGVSVSQRDTWGAVKEAKVQFQVWSQDDFNNIDTLYFKPGFPALLEFGHSCYVDNSGNVEFLNPNTVLVGNGEWFDEHKLFGDFEVKIHEKIKTYQGNYQGFVGYIVNFDYKSNGKGGYDCSITMLSKGSVLSGISIAGPAEAPLRDNTDSMSEDENCLAKSAYHNILTAFNSFKNASRNADKEWENFTVKTLEDIKKGISSNKNLKNVFANLNLNQHIEGKDSCTFGKAEILRVPMRNRNRADKAESQYFMSLGTLLEFINQLNLGKSPAGSEIGGKLNDKLRFISYFTDFRDQSTIPQEYATFDDHFSINPLYVLKPATPEFTDWKDGKDILLTGTDVIPKITNKKTGTVSAVTYPDEKRFRGNKDILSLCVDFGAFVDIIDNMIDVKAKDTFYSLEEAINQLLAGMQKALGNVNNFIIGSESENKLSVGEGENKKEANLIPIIDTNRIDSAEKDKELPRIHLSGLYSTVLSAEVSSQISQDLVNEVSIASTGEDGASAALVKWDQGCVRRHTLSGKKENNDPTSDESTEDPKKEFITIYNKNGIIVKYEKDSFITFCKKVKRMYQKVFDGARGLSQAEGLVDDMCTENQIIVEEIFKKYLNLGVLSEDEDLCKNCGILPMRLELTMKGLGGFVVGESFGIYPGYVPTKYDDWGYIITGVSENIDSSGWTTKLKTQYFPKQDKDRKQTPKRDNLNTGKSKDKSTMKEAPKQESQENQKHTPSTCESNWNSKTVPPSKGNLARAQTALKEVFSVCPEVASMCARYVYRLASRYTNKVPLSETPTVHAGGNANSDSYRSNLKALGYKEILVGTELTTSDCVNFIGSTKFGGGDILIYWSNQENPSDSSEAYGHTQFYTGQGCGWASSKINNYGAPFVYRSRTNQHCWTLYYLSAPGIKA